MLTIAGSIPAASTRRPAKGTVRLRLKPARRSCGFVHGAWWPRTADLGSELPALLAALSIEDRGDDVIVTAHHEWPNVISLVGPPFGRLDLLVVPPYTEATHAYDIVSTAASVNNASTPDQLLGNTGP